MLKLIVTFIFFHFVFISCAQNGIKKFVKQAAVPITTIDPNATNYFDLEVIGNAIGEAKIVMLGEQDHGDAPTFLAKTRLIKYLHEEKGFNIVAFESDFFGLNYGWDNLKKEKGLLDSFIQMNILPIWTYCHTCRNLFYQYIPDSYNTNRPITITGFDNQMVLQYSSKNIVSKLDSVLRSLDVAIVSQDDYVSEVLPTIDSLKNFYSVAPKNPAFYLKCDYYLHEMKRQAGKKLGMDNFWMMTIDNLIQESKAFQTKNSDFSLSNRVRDSQMGQNLRWITEVKYPKEKVIVWAANGHVAKNSGRSNNYPYSMGTFFTRDSLLLRQTYIIGFTSYDGVAGRLGWENYALDKPMRDGFENWIDKSSDYAFVNFKNFKEKAEPFYLKGQMHSNLRKDWSNIFDGVFFIRKMYPCEK